MELSEDLRGGGKGKERFEVRKKTERKARGERDSASKTRVNGRYGRLTHVITDRALHGSSDALRLVLEQIDQTAPPPHESHHPFPGTHSRANCDVLVVVERERGREKEGERKRERERGREKEGERDFSR